MRLNQFTTAGKAAIKKAQNTPIICKVNSIVKDADYDVVYYSTGDARRCDFITISDVDFTKYGAPIFTIFNILALQKRYNLEIINDIPYNEKLDAPCVFVNHDYCTLDEETSAALLIPVNDAPISETIDAILADIEKTVNDYPLIDDEAFYAWEYEKKADYIYKDFISDFQEIFYWPLAWFNLKFPEKSDADFLEWLKNDLPYSDADGVIDNIEQHINITREGNLDFASDTLKPYARELAAIAREYILELRNKRINGWRKNWLQLPGIPVKEYE